MTVLKIRSEGKRNKRITIGFAGRGGRRMNASVQPAAIDVVVRNAGERDVPGITAIYAHHVRTGLATFEVEPPDAAEMARRRTNVLACDLPYFVAEGASGILGYAYVAPYRTRAGYRYTVEDSIYVDPAAVGRGVGAAAARAPDRGLRVVRLPTDGRGDRRHRQSRLDRPARGVRLHARRHAPSVGFKFGRWVDSVLMQRGRAVVTAPARRRRGAVLRSHHDMGGLPAGRSSPTSTSTSCGRSASTR